MQQYNKKLSKSILIAQLALFVCCLGPAIFLLLTTGAVVSFFIKKQDQHISFRNITSLDYPFNYQTPAC
jgi:hypothetical protein